MTITVRDAVVQYGKSAPVLDGINLTVDKGEFFTLLGSSGCGKSTLLRSIAGFAPVRTGTITIGGRDVTTVPSERRGVGMVFQSYALFPHLSVGANVAFGLDRAKMGRVAVRRAVDEILTMVGIERLADRMPAELSGGQQQRVASARALIARPSVLLLDEPLSNLDVALRISTRREIRRVHETSGTTTVYVTHDQVEALDLSDRIAVLRDGVVEQVGTPQQVYDHPANTYVFRFLGGESVDLDPVWSRELRVDARPDDQVLARPERLLLDRVHNGPKEQAGRVTVTDRDFWGTTVRYRVAHEQSPTLVEVLCTSGHDPVLAPGDDALLRTAPGAVHVFDSAGLRRGATR